VWYHPGRLAEQLLETPSPPSGDAFAEALAAGESSAIRLAYRQHHEVVRAFARRLLGSGADAEELVQDTFLAIPSAMRRFRGDCSLRTFFLSIAANQARNVLRGRKRRRSAEDRLQADPDAAPPSATRPDEALLRQELAQRLTRAFDCLSEDQRIAFVLSEVEERNSSELSLILGVPASTIRARVAAAKEKLRTELARGDQGELP
jgi:RNA polymerase sigma-70 factor (ECF subfamily)